MISDLTQLNIIYQPKQKTSPQLGVAKNTNNPLPQATTIHVKHHRLLVGQTYETPTHTHTSLNGAVSHDVSFSDTLNKSFPQIDVV